MGKKFWLGIIDLRNSVKIEFNSVTISIALVSSLVYNNVYASQLTHQPNNKNSGMVGKKSS
jgi:hypothetical protein